MFKKSQILLATLAVILLVSCNENLKEKESVELENSPKIEVPTKNENPVEAVKSTATGFGGIYVNKKYVDRLLSTQSPKKAQDVTPVTMIVLPDDFKKDATIILGFHEGIMGKILMKDGGYLIPYENSKETSFTFNFENQVLKSKKDEFLKLKTNGNKNDFKVAEQILFAGTYNMAGKRVEFTSNGKITGLDLFSYYSVIIDYYDAGMQVDKIRLGKNAEESKLYGFAFKHDTLTIYELKCLEGDDDFCEVVKNGKKLFQMTKKNS